jgi:DNA polymerase-1
MTRIEDLTGRKFATGTNFVEEVLKAQGITLEYNSKTGNSILNKKSLGNMDNAIASTILELREHEKKAGASYAAYLRFTGDDGILHPTFNIGGTDTGRFSSSNPNIQQVPKEEELEDVDSNPVRAAFVPREGFIYVAIDYDQMEYRLMADYAGELEMIEAINAGEDPHTFVARMLDILRKQAKTVNFGLLYGMGIGSLGDMLGLDFASAKGLKQRYFRRLPRVENLFEASKTIAMSRGYIFNAYGRRVFLDEPKWAYKLVNYLIQGTGADIIRHAMVKIHKLLLPMQSAMVAQIHDELLFEIHKSELHIIPELVAIMENEYQPFNGMKLTAGASWSAKSWAVRDMKEGIPTTEDLKEVA